jgi:hypothetical protein
MRSRVLKHGSPIWLMAFALAAPSSSIAADATVAPGERGQANDAELEEVVVAGLRISDVHQDPQTYFDWLARLVGEFTVEGYVDVSPRDGPRDVLTAEGTANCIGFGVAPGVQCELRVRWPAHPTAPPTLEPAMMLFGFKENGYNYDLGGYEISEFSIKHALIDNRGIFESGHGVHEGEDTVVSKSHCAAIRVDCERMVRITASPDLRTVEMLIELNIENHQAVRYTFLMNRVPGSKAMVYGRKEQKEVPK